MRRCRSVKSWEISKLSSIHCSKVISKVKVSHRMSDKTNNMPPDLTSRHKRSPCNSKNIYSIGVDLIYIKNSMGSAFDRKGIRRKRNKVQRAIASKPNLPMRGESSIRLRHRGIFLRIKGTYFGY